MPGCRSFRTALGSFQSSPLQPANRLAFRLGLALFFWAMAGGAQSALAGTAAGFVTVDAPGAASSAYHGTALTAVSAGGDAAGVSLDASGLVHAFVRSSKGAVSVFDAPRFTSQPNQATGPIAFDAAGDLLGIYVDSNTAYHGLIRSASGVLSTFDVPGAGTGQNQGTMPVAINASGDVAGLCIDSNGMPHGFVRTAEGAISVFDAPGTIDGTTGVSINASGAVAGTYVDANKVAHGFVRLAAGAITAVSYSGAGTAPGQGTAVTTIDSTGKVGGFYLDPSNVAHGFVLTAAGKFTSFDAPNAGTGVYQGTYPFSFPFAFDTAGDLSGFTIDANNAVHGFFRSASGAIGVFDAPGASPVANLTGAITRKMKAHGRAGLLARIETLFGRVGSLGEVNGVRSFSHPGGGVFNGVNGVYLGTLGMNLDSAGDIAGAFLDGEIVIHSFVRRATGSMTVIDDPKAGPGAYQGTLAMAVNPSGTVVGTYEDENSVLHGFVLTLAQAAATVQLNAAPASALFGQPVTLTARVAAGTSAPPNGETVWFMDGAKVLEQGTLTAGQAVVTTTALKGGSHSLTAVYPGDPSFAGATSNKLTETIGKANSTTTLTATVTRGGDLEFTNLTAKVKAQYGGVPTGTVGFLSGSTQLGKAPVQGGVATLSTSALPVGTSQVTASYLGDSNLNGSSSASLPVTVKQLKPTITWPQPSPIAFGIPLSSLQLDASATVPGTFVYTPKAGVVLASGTQTLNVTFTPTDTARYAPNSASVQLTVKVGSASTPSVTVTPAASSVTTLQPLSVKIAVGGHVSIPVPTGSVVLSGGGYSSSALALSNGAASVEIPAGALSVGSVTLLASYTPDAAALARYASATGKSSAVTVTRGTPAQGATVTLSVASGGAQVSSVKSGAVVVLTATVKSAATSVTRGLVNFCDASAAFCTDIHLLGSAQLTPAGTAVFRFRPGPGSHTYKAVFAGTRNYKTGSSLAAPLTVTAGSLAPVAAGIARSGPVGSYTLTATVGGQGPLAFGPPISFIDTSFGNAYLGTATLVPGTSSPGFIPVSTPISSGYSNVVVAGDLNGDGIQDLAVFNSDNQTVTVLLGKGDGTFTALAAQQISLPSNVWGFSAAVACDLNGDGKPDLAVAGDGYPGSVSILIGKGDGTFAQTASNLQVGIYPIAIVAGDWNGDGIPDLAVANSGNNTLSILLGNGRGGFTASTAILSSISSPHGLAAGDFNGDGKLDLAVANWNTLAILLGNGDGTFIATASPLPTGSGPNALAVGDFNGDGVLDLAVADQGNASIGIFLGRGDGTFTASSTLGTGSVLSLALGDFNGDGIADVATLTGLVYAQGAWLSAKVQVFTGNRDGSFSLASASTLTSQCPDAMTSASFNSDGVPGLAIPACDGALTTLLTERSIASATLPKVAVTGAGPHLVAASYPGDSVYAPAVSGATPLYAAAPAPTFSVPSGAYSAEQTVAIADAAPGAMIYYTTDGSAPGTNNNRGKLYMGPVVVSSTQTLKAVASSSAYGQSPVATAAYTIR